MEQSAISGYAPINGLNMYYEIYGVGKKPLVLVHGGGSTIESNFGYIIPLLSAAHTIIAVELQAHGRTTDRNTPESFEQDADDVAALLAHLNIQKADFLGFSNGGSTVMQIAVRHAALVDKMIIVAGLYKRDGLIPGFFDGLQQADISNMPAYLQEAFLQVIPDRKRLQVMFEKDKARMQHFTDWPDADLQSIKASALFVVADRDVITVNHTVKMSQHVDGAALVVLPGTHGSFIETFSANESIRKGSKLPSVFITLVEEFLVQQVSD